MVDKSLHDLFPAEVTIACGGRTFSMLTSAHTGSPHNPLTWNDACEKFVRYTRTILDEKRQRAIMEAIAALQDEDDMGHVAALTAKA